MPEVIDKKLLEILACPKCKKSLELTEDGKFLICHECKLRYPIINGIPDMIIEDALEID